MITDKMFRAFADETRLRILHLLTKGELCVCDIMSVLKSPQSKVSRHLGYLKSAGLVTDRRDGIWKHYALAKPANKFQKQLIGCIDGCLQDVPVLVADAQRFTAYRKDKSRCR